MLVIRADYSLYFSNIKTGIMPTEKAHTEGDEKDEQTDRNPSVMGLRVIDGEVGSGYIFSIIAFHSTSNCTCVVRSVPPA